MGSSQASMEQSFRGPSPPSTHQHIRNVSRVPPQKSTFLVLLDRSGPRASGVPRRHSQTT